MLTFHNYFSIDQSHFGRMTNYFKKNSTKVFKTFVTARRSKVLAVHLSFNFKRGSLFFILHVRFLRMIRLVYSKSLKVLINFVSNYKEVFFKPLGTLKPKVWRLFFYRFFQNMPNNPLYITIRNWEGQLNSFYNIIYRHNNLRKVLVDNNKSFAKVKLKKLRRIKKKLKKKMF